MSSPFGAEHDEVVVAYRRKLGRRGDPYFAEIPEAAGHPAFRMHPIPDEAHGESSIRRLTGYAAVTSKRRRAAHTIERRSLLLPSRRHECQEVGQCPERSLDDPRVRRRAAAAHEVARADPE